MADLLARGVFELAADSSGVTAGVSEADAAFENLERSAKQAGASIDSSMQKAATGAAAAGASTDKLDSTTRRFINSLERESQQAGRTRSEYLELRAAQLGVAGAADPFLRRIRETEQALQRGSIAFDKYGNSVKQNAAALRQVPAQLTDIIVSLQGGQAPLTVLLQQGGQLRDIFGGIAPAFQAVGQAALRLVNPFTLAASAIATITAGYYFGTREADNYAKSLILTGNAAGSTVGELNNIAVAISGVAGTQGNASAALSQLADTGEVSASSLQKVALAAVQLERTAGVAVADTVKQFAELGKSPTDAARRLNEQYRFLTTSVYEQIRALEQAGRASEAAAVAQNAFADALLNRSSQLEARLGSIERGWIAVKDAVKGAADAILSIGRTDTSASLQKQVDALERLRPVGTGPEAQGYQARIDAIKAEIENQRELERMNKRVASTEAQRAADAEAGIRAIEVVSRANASAASNQEKMNKALADYSVAIETIRRDNPKSVLLDPETIKRTEASIRAQGTQRPTASRQARQRAEVRPTVDVSDIRRELDQLTGAYRNAESVLDAMRSSGLVSEAEYYDAKRGFIVENQRVQEQAIAAEIARLQQTKTTAEGQADLDKRIADAKARLVNVQANASTQTILLNLREQSSLAQLARGYEDARLAQEALLAQQQQANNRQLSGFGQGGAQRDRDSRVTQIDDRFAQEQSRIEAERQLLRIQQEGRLTEEQAAQFERRLELVREFHSLALEEEDSYQARMLEKQSDFAVGASEALNNYLENSRNVAQQTEELFSNAFQGMEDALVKFIQTGKLDFKSLADSIVADILRIIVQQQLSNMLAAASGLFKPGSGGIGGFIGDLTGAILGTGGASDASQTAEAAARATAEAAATAAITARVAAETAAQAAITAAQTAATATLAANTTATTLATSQIAALTASASAASAALASVAASSAASGASDAAGSLISIAGALAGGGPVTAGAPYLVGEEGPELFVPRASGAIIPAQQTQAMRGNTTVNAPINISVSGAIDRRTREQVAADVQRAVGMAVVRGTA